MIKTLLSLLLAAACLLPPATHAASPLRVFIRAGEKTHAPGAHDYPRFLEEWTTLLTERGLQVDGALAFPTAKQLANTDVLILHSKEAGNINIGTERKNLDAFIARGGGLVVIHGGAVSRTDPDYYKSIIGGSWRFPTTKWLEAPMSLYFTDRENPITKDISNFDIEDEIYYDMDLRDDIHVLAAAYTPKAIDTGGKGNKDAQAAAAEAVARKRGVNIYDIQPQVWTYERKAEGGSEPYRAFVHIPGHWYKNFSHNGVRTMLLRGIAWAGKRDNVDEFCKTDELGDALRYVEGGVPRPGELPKHLEVHPDFEISLVASEPLINNPMNIDWDEKGRLWVVETPEYPNGLRQSNVAAWMDSGSVRPGVYDRDPLDRISILSDTDGDGVMDSKKVFADKLELVTSSVFYRDGVIACSAPDIWYLQDTDGDEVADKRTKLYTNLGTRDTHAVINNMRWGRDGWVYATHGYSSTEHVMSGDGSKQFGPAGMGVVRFKPDGTRFEQYTSKGGNTWGLETTLEGEVFYTQPTTGNPLVHVVLPEYLLAKGKLPGVTGTNGLLPGEPTFPAMTWEQTAYVQIDQVGRYTAGAGCVIYQGGAWPAKWNHSYFTTEPTLNIIGHFFTQPDGPTYSAAKEPGREETEFIRSTNLWFRPIEVRTGPDGALYTVDFCNQAIIHNDTRGPTHGPANAAVRPDRDHYYGRVWRVQHKKAKALDPLHLDRANKSALELAAKSPNKHTRETAWRLLREDHGAAGQLVGSSAVNVYDRARAIEPAALLELVSKAQDDWTLSALIAAASERAPAILTAALKNRPSEQLLAFTSALAPKALWNADGSNNAIPLLQACALARPPAAPIVENILAGLADPTVKPPPFTPEIKNVLVALLDEPATATFTLPLVAAWDKNGTMAETTRALTDKLVATLGNPRAGVPERAAAARSLIRFQKSNASILPAIETIVTTKGDLALQRELVAALGSQDGPKIGDILIGRFTDFSPELQLAAFDQIIKRPGWSGRLLNRIENTDVNPVTLGPGNLARLRTHPDRKISRRANTVLDALSPEALAKNELIAKLTPEVEKPGDPAKGKMLYAACAICHKLGDIGVEVGPALDGMGAHGPAELLVHILDPNREVEPSFYANNVTTRNGEVFAGVVTSENNASLTLATQVGIVEIQKSQIKSRENTKRSLMPEGFEALGAEGLRDLLAYMVGEAAKDFRILDLSSAYTASSDGGLFNSSAPNGGKLNLPVTGNLTIHGVPFYIQSPGKSRSGNNLIVLKGGPRKEAYSNTQPQSVTIPVGVPAKKLHLLSGIGGWAFPYGGGKGEPALKAEIHYEGGQRETFTLKNGEHFADYIRKVDVPASAYVEELADRTQVRWLTLELKKSAKIEKLTLSSFANAISPVVVAATADLQGKSSAPVGKKVAVAAPPKKPKGKGKGPKGAKRKGPPPPLPPTPVNWEKGKTSVLLIGGGSSHDFKRFFGDADTATLARAGFTTHYTEDRAQATELLAQADVAVISVNRVLFDTPAYRKALMDRLDAGKGVLMLHPGTWYGYKEWPELNAQVVGGGSRGHDKLGPFSVEVTNPNHPVMAGVTRKFSIIDELYYMNAEGTPEGTAPINVLARTSPSQKYGKPHPSVWTTAHPKARVVGIALGHDERCHDHEAYRKILSNAVQWIGAAKGKKSGAPPHALNLDEQGWDPDTTFPQLTPEEAIATIEVPDGYHLEVVASEPMVEEPVSFAFGPAGALYVCEWRTYMQDEHATGQMDPVSRVVKLVDTDGDGVMDKRTVFIDKALLPRTVLVLEDRVLVNFTDTESIWAYFDDDGDGVSDRHELAYEGKPNKGNIEHQASGMVWNLDNRIDGNYARYRYDSETGKITATPHSLSRISQWGLARDDDGRLYCSWAGGANPAHSFQFPAGYPIVRVPEHADGYEIPYASCKVWDQSSGDYKEEEQIILQKFSATGGQSVLRSPLYPEWYGNVVTPEPVGRFLRMSRIEEDDKTGLRVAHNQFHKSEFIRSTDAYFRPVWSDIGPDGCLYFADMYRGIIQEKSWFPTDYDDPRTGWVNRYHRIKKWGMLKAFRNGRIYRLVPNDKNRKPGDVPDMTGKSGPVLAAQLGHPNGWWRDTAQKLIVTGNKRDAIPALKEIAHDPVSPLARINARWTLDGLDALTDDLITSGLQDKHPRVRATSIRLAENNPKFPNQLAAMTDDPDPNVAIQLYLSLNDDKTARTNIVQSLPGNPLFKAIHRRQREAAAAKTLSREAQRGLVIYDSLCITCHGPDGRGVREGAKLLAPNLAESKWFKQGRIDIIARILLKGQFGPIDGLTYGEGIMVPLELAYDDRQLTDVINYVGETWHNWPKKRFTLEHVGRIRGEITDRTTPWTEAELRKIAE